MYDELTQVDIDKINEELENRILTLRPKILEEVKITRSYGDLSENAEYHAAKAEQRRNESRIRYLTRMLRTAKVISGDSKPDEVGIFDEVEYFDEEMGTLERVRLTTTLRQDVLNGIISTKSPVGMALLGHKIGDRLEIKVDGKFSYYIVIKSIKKGVDDSSLEISKW